MTVVQMPPRPAAPTDDDVLERTIATLEDYAADLDRLARVARVLRAFYQAPLVMGSLHPVLTLALEMNPDLEQR
jgi:hypothetical protein